MTARTAGLQPSLKFSMRVRSSLGPCSAAGSSARKGAGVPKMNLDMPFVAWWSGRCLVILIFLEAGMALTTSWLSAAASWTWRLWLRIGGTPSWWGRSSTDAAWLSGHLWRLGGHRSYRRRRRPGRLRAKRRLPFRVPPLRLRAQPLAPLRVLRREQLQAAQRKFPVEAQIRLCTTRPRRPRARVSAACMLQRRGPPARSEAELFFVAAARRSCTLVR